MAELSPLPRKGIAISLMARLALLFALMILLTTLLTLGGLRLLPGEPWLVAGVVLLLVLPLMLSLLHRQLQPLLALFHAMSGTVNSYQDGDYAFSLHWPRNDEVRDLVDAHNQLGQVLREQRLDLIQRELLLDSMLQNTPVAMLLIADKGPIVFANLAARQLLNQGRKLEGHSLNQLLQHLAPALCEALARGGDGLFSANPAHAAHAASAASAPGNSAHSVPGDDDGEEIYHLSRRNFSLNGRNHELLLLRHLTTELRRQEVQTWKKVIRVISHELNNSLAPVASLANSGLELVRRGQVERLPQILQTIEERTRHLESFIHGYARFAKLPTPRLSNVAWPAFIHGLQAHTEFTLPDPLPDESALFDPAQMEQALLNLLKNAHESGSAPEAVSLAVRRMQGGFRIEVMDAGQGMNEAVMANALVPFYSTKRSGTGLGLALAREIIEAHGGRIMLGNREGGGVVVSLILPSN
jgi:nitrogen fixation/metabolism regulation signal transduction histidine kinase